MFHLDMADPETWWLNVVNLAMGAMVLAGIVVVAVATLRNVLARKPVEAPATGDMRSARPGRR